MTVDNKTVGTADAISTVNAVDTTNVVTSLEIKKEAEGETADKTDQEQKQGKPYDDVFHTLIVDCPELVIPLINEVFGEHYNRYENVSKYNDTFFIVASDKRETDSHIGIRQKKYHIECQSTTDGTLMIRLFEYDAQMAIEDAVQKKREVIFTFPYTAVMYLRCNRNTPSQIKVTIKVPGDSATYDIPIMKVPEYTLEEIMEKELFFLLPFHLFRYEKELKLCENDKERLEKLKETYRRIMEYLNQKLEEGRLTALQRWVIQETTKKVAENLAMKYKKVVKEVIKIMGGQVIELECVKQWNAGKAEGWNLGLAALVNTLKSIFNDFDKVYDEIIKNESYSNVTEEQVRAYYN